MIESTKKPGIFLISALVATFLFGAAAGSGATVYYIKNRIFGAISRGPEGVRELLMERMVIELALTAEQKQNVAPIVTDAHREVVKIRLRFQPEFTQIIEGAINKIVPLLDANQKVRMETLLQRWRKHLQSSAAFASSAQSAPTAPVSESSLESK